MAGRGSEVANEEAGRIRPLDVSEDAKRYRVIRVDGNSSRPIISARERAGKSTTTRLSDCSRPMGRGVDAKRREETLDNALVLVMNVLAG